MYAQNTLSTLVTDQDVGSYRVFCVDDTFPAPYGIVHINVGADNLERTAIFQSTGNDCKIYYNTQLHLNETMQWVGWEQLAKYSDLTTWKEYIPKKVGDNWVSSIKLRYNEALGIGVLIGSVTRGVGEICSWGELIVEFEDDAPYALYKPTPCWEASGKSYDGLLMVNHTLLYYSPIFEELGNVSQTLYINTTIYCYRV